jgi:hypothetical protein
MAVCACGRPMELRAGWCQSCWARWSVWFMRAGGRWVQPNGFVCYSTCYGDRGEPCHDCRQQHMLQELVDEAERVATR